MTSTPEVLFVCVHNAGRSQMAAALLAHHAGERITVRSAGTAPADTINPAVVEVMAEMGIDLIASGATPKIWQLDDPAGRGVDQVRPIRDEIESRVLALIDELIGTEPPAT